MEAVIKELEALASDMVMEALNGDATDKAEKAFKARLRTALQCSDCAAKQGVPYAVLVREIGESSFFEHRPVKPGSDEHRFAIQDPHCDYIEVYTHPTQQGLDATRTTPVVLGAKLFSFSSMQDWINGAQRRWKQARVSADRTICLDQKGRVLQKGLEFMRAEKEGVFPVDVYLALVDDTLRSEAAQAKQGGV